MLIIFKFFFLGMYKRDSKEVFDLIIKLINNMKRKCSANALDQLICSMNRTILYQLSRSIELLTDQIMVLDVLHRITNLKSIVFSQLNTQYEFFACVAHCLLTLTDTSEGLVNCIQIISCFFYLFKLNSIF